MRTRRRQKRFARHARALVVHRAKVFTPGHVSPCDCGRPLCRDCEEYAIYDPPCPCCVDRWDEHEDQWPEYAYSHDDYDDADYGVLPPSGGYQVHKLYASLNALLDAERDECPCTWGVDPWSGDKLTLPCPHCTPTAYMAAEPAPLPVEEPWRRRDAQRARRREGALEPLP